MSLKERLNRLKIRLLNIHENDSEVVGCQVKNTSPEELDHISLDSSNSNVEKNKIESEESIEEISDHLAKDSDISLDAKVDEFIDWYFKNMVKGHYTDVGEFYKAKDMRNFIEKWQSGMN